MDFSFSSAMFLFLCLEIGTLLSLDSVCEHHSYFELFTVVLTCINIVCLVLFCHVLFLSLKILSISFIEHLPITHNHSQLLYNICRERLVGWFFFISSHPFCKIICISNYIAICFLSFRLWKTLCHPTESY